MASIPVNALPSPLKLVAVSTPVTTAPLGLNLATCEPPAATPGWLVAAWKKPESESVSNVIAGAAALPAANATY